MTRLLHGPLAPIGWRIGLVEAPLGPIIDDVVRWRQMLGERINVERVNDGFPSCLHWLEPLESPWSRGLFIELGGRWSLFVNNHFENSDPAAIVEPIALRLHRRAVVASFHPLTTEGNALAEVRIFGMEGEPPLHIVRAITAHAENGEWSWHESGDVQPWETPERYADPNIAGRLSRELIIEYLGAIGADVDNDDAFGMAALVSHIGPWRRRTLTLDQARAQLGVVAG